jgi:hypothetical protein
MAQYPKASGDRRPGALRTYGPAVAAYLLATAVTGAYQWGDSIDYVIEIRAHMRFLEFGHLFWRPLGSLLAALAQPSYIPGATNEQTAILVLLVAVCWLAGLGCVVWLRGLLRWAGMNGWPADFAVVAFILSQTFLNYTQTASSYIPGLAMLLLGCYLLAREAASERPFWHSLAAGAALAAAVGFWFLYVWALPAALLLPLFLGGFDRKRFRLAARAAVVCVVVIGISYGVALASLRIESIDGLRAWIADASHGVARVHGVSRAAFGLPRSFIYLGNDGVLFKRFLLHDPLNPTSAVDLVRLSLWKLALFYLFLLSLGIGLLFSPRGRQLLGLLAVAALPTVGFAVAWQGGDLERYLPLYPFLFLAVAGLFALKEVPLACRVLALVFILAAGISNVPVMARPVLWREQQRLHARVAGLEPLLKPNSRVFFVRDEVAGLQRDFPLHAAHHELPLEGAVAPGLEGNQHWRPDLAKRILAVWDKDGDVWIAKRLLAEKPQPEWNWVEGDDPELSWRDLSAFFRALDTDADVGGADGFGRVAPSSANRQRLSKIVGEATH